jgi:hypothetical protein
LLVCCVLSIPLCLMPWWTARPCGLTIWLQISHSIRSHDVILFKDSPSALCFWIWLVYDCQSLYGTRQILQK